MHRCWHPSDLEYVLSFASNHYVEFVHVIALNVLLQQHSLIDPNYYYQADLLYSRVELHGLIHHALTLNWLSDAKVNSIDILMESSVIFFNFMLKIIPTRVLKINFKKIKIMRLHPSNFASCIFFKNCPKLSSTKIIGECINH